jgi:hypothetical protein
VVDIVPPERPQVDLLQTIEKLCDSTELAQEKEAEKIFNKIKPKPLYRIV